MTHPSDTPDPLAADPSVADVQRRTLAIIFTSQVLGGAGLAAGITVGALLAQQMVGATGVAGLPTALFTLGSALTAFLVGAAAQRWGRRPSLASGFLAGGLGALGVVVAARMDSVSLLFASLFVYGAGTATNLQARYATTDLASAEHRGRAISVAMVATTFGAVVGPNLVEPLGDLATAINVPRLVGPFLLAAVAYLAAAVALFTLLRPDPLLLARAAAAGSQSGTGDVDVVAPRPSASAYVGASIMVANQLVMIAIMTMTPVHMLHHHHELGDVGVVIGVHVAGMFLPSPLTGFLVDRVGRLPMAAASGLTLLSAGVVAALVPGSSMTGTLVALALLGIGWNFGLISGTTLIVDGTVPVNRARTQGTFDVLFALAGATGGGISGVIVATGGFGTLALLGGLLGLLFLPLLAWFRLTG